MTDLLFGLNISTSAAPGNDPVADARRAEDLGFDFVSANDHPYGTTPNFETWTMLSWIAAATSRIRVATRVLGVPYRPPTMLAKMAESFDRLSGGRLILGLGGGASDDAFRAFGLGVRSPREKIEGLEEAIRVIRGLWTESDFSYAGQLYHTDAATIEPKPHHRIPIWLGTFRERGLELTGRLADGWIPSLDMAPPEQGVGMRDRVLSAARNAGRDPDEITCVYNLEVLIDTAGNPQPSVISGGPEEVAEQLGDLVGIGFTAMNFITVGPDVAQQQERLAREVIPVLRARNS
jgi:alkanesulfonate monooxygenase SsuD/methylene tetrahydromethanopterin reductase-like flavin-dependent oxidoreductase (luciferase family)